MIGVQRGHTFAGEKQKRAIDFLFFYLDLRSLALPYLSKISRVWRYLIIFLGRICQSFDASVKWGVVEVRFDSLFIGSVSSGTQLNPVKRESLRTERENAEVSFWHVVRTAFSLNFRFRVSVAYVGWVLFLLRSPGA